MRDLAIEPPELSIAVYSDQDEAETFACLHTAGLDADGSAFGPLEVAGRDLGFEMFSDLGDARRLIDVDESRQAQLVAGRIQRKQAFEMADWSRDALRLAVEARALAAIAWLSGTGGGPIGAAR